MTNETNDLLRDILAELQKLTGATTAANLQALILADVKSKERIEGLKAIGCIIDPRHPMLPSSVSRYADSDEWVPALPLESRGRNSWGYRGEIEAWAEKLRTRKVRRRVKTKRAA